MCSSSDECNSGLCGWLYCLPTCETDKDCKSSLHFCDMNDKSVVKPYAGTCSKRKGSSTKIKKLYLKEMKDFLKDFRWWRAMFKRP